MKKKMMLTAALATLAFNQFAQNQEDLKAIENLCGCFEVTFNYAETFTNDTSKKYYAKPLDNHAVIEYVFPVEKSKDKLALQHILVVNDKMMIKHWREDWTYENNVFWNYDVNDSWVKTSVPAGQVKGQWTQTVWEVSDAPRYQGSSQWIRNNGQTFWLNTADAPLPRREYTTRRDYNVMNRTNRLTLTDYGYMHEQDNIKILRENGKDEILAYEKGYNKYVKVDDSKCAAAKQFWNASKDEFWKEVRTSWEDYFKNGKKVELTNRVDGKLLHEALDESEKKNLTGTERTKEIKSVLDKFVKAS